MVNVRVNGGKEVTFFIDTGGSEVTLDTDFAKELGVPQFGAVQGTFSGGQHAEVGLGRVDSVTLGDWTIKNVPTAMLPLRQLSEGFGVKQLRRNHRYHSVLPFPDNDGLSAWRTRAAPEGCSKP